MDTRATLDAIDDDIFQERTPAAREKLATLGSLDDHPAEVRARAEVLRLRAAAISGDAYDRIAIDGRRALVWAPEGTPRALLLAEIAYALTAKRCAALARETADLANQTAPRSSIGPSIHGWIGLRFDDRAGARAAYEEASSRKSFWTRAARNMLATLLSRDRQEEAVTVITESPAPTAALLVELARIENERKNFSAARDALVKARAVDPDVSFGFQAEYNHAMRRRRAGVSRRPGSLPSRRFQLEILRRASSWHTAPTQTTPIALSSKSGSPLTRAIRRRRTRDEGMRARSSPGTALRWAIAPASTRSSPRSGTSHALATRSCRSAP